jgi:pilus assembly protein CpaE
LAVGTLKLGAKLPMLNETPQRALHVGLEMGLGKKAMQSKQSNSAPAVLILTADKTISALGETLWAAGVDYATVGTWADVRRTLQVGRISMAVIDGDLPPAELEHVLAELPEVPLQAVLWLVSAEPTRTEHLRLPQTNRPWERISKPLWPEELLHRVKAVLGDGDMASGRGSVTSMASNARRPEHGQVVAVFSNKGGVGKSTIAVNMAVGLRRLYGDRVLLIDADLYYGDLEPLLDAHGRHTIADLCIRQSREPDSLLSLTTAHASGISFLPRPAEMARIETLDMSLLVQALPVFASLFDHVVVNMSTALDEFNLSILEAAHRIVVVTTPEMPSAVNTARFMEVAARLKLASKTSLVLNRADYETSTETIEQHLSLQFAARLPSAGRLIVKAGNTGKSMFMSDPHLRQDITRALAGLVEHVAGRPRAARRGWNLISRVLGRAA